MIKFSSGLVDMVATDYSRGSGSGRTIERLVFLSAVRCFYPTMHRLRSPASEECE